MNILGESNNQLQPVNYKPLLEKILAVLRSEKLFTRRPDQLVIDVDKIAAAVASASLPNPLGTSTFDITSATINFGTDKASNHFSEQVKQIQNHLKAELTRVVGPSSSIEQYVGSLVKDLSSFTGPVSGLGFSYPFQQQYELQKQRLYFE